MSEKRKKSLKFRSWLMQMKILKNIFVLCKLEGLLNRRKEISSSTRIGKLRIEIFQLKSIESLLFRILIEYWHTFRNFLRALSFCACQMNLSMPFAPLHEVENDFCREIYDTHTGSRSKRFSFCSIAWLIQFILRYLPSTHSTPDTKLRVSYWLTQSFIQTFEYILNIHFSELLTWTGTRQVILGSFFILHPFSCLAVMFVANSTINCL